MTKKTEDGVQRFVKRPIAIEAIQFHGDADSGYAVIRWAHEGLPAMANAIVRFADMAEYRMLNIRTLEGDLNAVAGDWIIKGVKGEFYPCKPDIFTETYELVDGER